MKKLCSTFIILLLVTFQVNAQNKSDSTLIEIPKSIYYSPFEKEFSPVKFAFTNTRSLGSHRFLFFDEARLDSNLSNSLAFRSFDIKPSKYYLDTYKKMYDLKGQTQTFIKIEQLYEVPPQFTGYKRNK